MVAGAESRHCGHPQHREGNPPAEHALHALADATIVAASDVLLHAVQQWRERMRQRIDPERTETDNIQHLITPIAAGLAAGIAAACLLGSDTDHG